jgi:uncharacterized protein YdhG (YjbR/CyaY superfamily)
MIASRKKFKTIDAYITSFPKDVAGMLHILRGVIAKIAPKAEEVMSYQIPTFKLNGNLVHFAAFTHHIGFYPGAAAIKVFKKDLVSYETSKGAVRFPLDKVLLLPLIRKIVRYRVQQNLTHKK